MTLRLLHPSELSPLAQAIMQREQEKIAAEIARKRKAAERWQDWRRGRG